MQALIDAETPAGDRRARMIAAFNRGYNGFQQTYRTCTPAATVAAVFGVVLAAGYILWTVQRVLTGPPNERWSHLPDANQWWEHTAMAGMLIAIVLVGIYPRILTDVVNGGIAPIAAILGGGS